MKKNNIRKYVKAYLGNSLVCEDEIKCLEEVIHSKMLFRYQEKETFSRRVELFLQEKLNISHVKLVCNATEALKTALISLSPKIGSIVLVPAISYIATVNCCLSAGLVPVLIDVDTSGHLDPIELKKWLEGNSVKPSAIIVVHLDGAGAQIEMINDICKSYNIPLIEDVAQSFSVKRNGKYLGTWGDIGCFSFQENKFISSGEGGAFITNNLDLFEKMCALSDQGSLRTDNGFPNWNKNLGFGSNLKITELSSAILYVQLNRLFEMQKSIRSNYNNIIKLIDKSYFYERDPEDIPISIWIEDHFFRKLLEENGLILYSWDYMLLPEHPIIKEKRSLYDNKFPWNYYNKEIVSKDKTAKTVSKRYCLPIPILEKDFEITKKIIKNTRKNHVNINSFSS